MIFIALLEKNIKTNHLCLSYVSNVSSRPLVPTSIPLKGYVKKCKPASRPSLFSRPLSKISNRNTVCLTATSSYTDDVCVLVGDALVFTTDLWSDVSQTSERYKFLIFFVVGLMPVLCRAVRISLRHAPCLCFFFTSHLQ